MTYSAIIENRTTGERKTLKLGRCGGLSRACDTARSKAPAGWTIIDVYGRT